MISQKCQKTENNRENRISYQMDILYHNKQKDFPTFRYLANYETIKILLLESKSGSNVFIDVCDQQKGAFPTALSEPEKMYNTNDISWRFLFTCFSSLVLFR